MEDNERLASKVDAIVVNSLMAIEFVFTMAIYFVLMHWVSQFWANGWLILSYAWALKANFDELAKKLKETGNGKEDCSKEKQEDSKDIDAKG